MPLDPHPGIPTPNTLADATKMRAQLDELFNPPACRVYTSSTFSVTSASTPVPFDSESFDNDAVHDTVTNNSRLTCKTAGIYRVEALLDYPSPAANGLVTCEIVKNGLGGSTIQNGRIVAAATHRYTAGDDGVFLALSGGIAYTLSGLVLMAVNDYVEMFVYRTTTASSSADGAAMSMVWQSTS